ncbi:MAG: primosomal protein N' [Planktomarina sp.]|nr:primosomal protein N' [Planktomarina sp.]
MSEPSFFYEGDLIAVLTSQPLGQMLDYKAPVGGCWHGAFVEVPIGPRKTLGVVWGEGKGDFEYAKVRSVIGVLDLPIMQPSMQEFLRRVSDYTLSPMHMMLRLATRAPGLNEPPSMQHVYRKGPSSLDRKTAQRQQVLAVLQSSPDTEFTLKELVEASDSSASVVKGLVNVGAVKKVSIPKDTQFPTLNPWLVGKSLSDEQKNAVLHLKNGDAGYNTTLLKGVTGSGKTEVYLEAVADCLKRGQQVLVLIPEIALTAEFLLRVVERFGARPAEWHSGVTMTERRRTWKMIGQGKAQMVVGARSALFLPFKNLGLIVVDEEHDSSYKQEDGVLYNARDMAVLRASLVDGKVILASATPSLESWVNVESGKYKKIELMSRFGRAVMPRFEAIDMRKESLSSDRWISNKLKNLVEARLKADEQSLLFINRRGYAPITLCRSCGNQIGCDHCDARMVEHRFSNRLMCHQCGETKPVPKVCPSCNREGRLAAVGPGIERLAEEATELFPDAKVAVLSSDLFGSARALKAQILDLAQGKADIIIGTQLVAKGHNFPKLTLVGVIDVDLGLQGSDLRAAEKTFQLMRQVSGRAGRTDKPGTAVLQTHQPEHPVIKAILEGNEDIFWHAQAAERKAAGVPPYGRFVGIVISSTDFKEAIELGQTMARNIRPLEKMGAEVFGPAPAPVARIRGRSRVRLLVKAKKSVYIQSAISEWVSQFKLSKSLRLSIDIDPQSFY